jgi:hypothetical protein
MMAEVPVSINDLNDIAVAVSRDLLEKWAIDDRFTEEQLDEYSKYAADDTIFVINKYMEYLNFKMSGSIPN